MSMTFDEWYEEEEFEEYLNQCLENRSFDGHLDIKELLKEAWEAGRMNMTTRDI